MLKGQDHSTAENPSYKELNQHGADLDRADLQAGGILSAQTSSDAMKISGCRSQPLSLEPLQSRFIERDAHTGGTGFVQNYPSVMKSKNPSETSWRMAMRHR
jgi:hypothetical protein